MSSVPSCLNSEHKPPWKRAKRPFRSREDADAAFYNSLSSLYFTRRALRELNRRNRRVRPTTSLVSGPVQCMGNDALTHSSNDLKRFARHGGPDLRNLRGYGAKEMPSSHTPSKILSEASESTRNTTHRKSSAYHSDFQQHLIDHGVYPDEYILDGQRPPPPKNRREILERLAQPRPSLSRSTFSDEMFFTFSSIDRQASTERMVMGKPFSMIVGQADIPSAGDVLFNNLHPLTDGTIVDAKPDYYDGTPQVQIASRIREELGSHIIPSREWKNPAAPNYFMEVKGPNGSPAVNERQACYAGALGARGMHQLRTFRMDDSEEMYDNNAYTITSTYQNGTLILYTTHLARSIDTSDSPEYFMTRLGGWFLIGSREQFCQGASALRNARDWAREQRDKVLAAANARLLDSSSHHQPAQTSAPLDLGGYTSLARRQTKQGLGNGHTKARLKKHRNEDSTGTGALPERKRRKKREDPYVRN